MYCRGIGPRSLLTPRSTAPLTGLCFWAVSAQRAPVRVRASARRDSCSAKHTTNSVSCSLALSQTSTRLVSTQVQHELPTGANKRTSHLPSHGTLLRVHFPFVRTSPTPDETWESLSLVSTSIRPVKANLALTEQRDFKHLRSTTIFKVCKPLAKEGSNGQLQT